jgi:hypothetical protein
MARGERTEHHPNRQVGRLRGTGLDQTPQQPTSRLRGKGLVSEEKSEPVAEPTSEYKTYESGGTVESRAKANKELRYRTGNQPLYPGTRFRGSGFKMED